MAGLKISLQTIMDLVLVTLAIIALYAIYAGLVSVFGTDVDKDTASVNNFEAVVRQVKAFDDIDSAQMPVYIKQDKMIIGFPRSDNPIVNVAACNTGRDNPKRPQQCGQSACICLCYKADGCYESSMCDTIDGNIKFNGDLCGAAVIPGREKPQTVYLKRNGDTISFCMEKC
jgi:hypothetical protein